MDAPGNVAAPDEAEAGDALPTGKAKVEAVEAMFDAVAPRYELLNRVLTFGLDARWRRLAVEALGLTPGSRVLDVACGTGDLCRELARHGLFPVGVDRSAGMLAAARRPLTAGAPLVRGDALALAFPGARFDGLVCGFAIRNLVALEPFFAECARVLRPGGRLVLLEVSRPRNPLARAVHHLWFDRMVPLVGGLLSDRAAYRYLPRSLAYLPPEPELLALLGAAGFEDARRRPLTAGAAQLLTGTAR